MELPALALNPNARPKPGALGVERTIITVEGALAYDTPETKGSRRRVPLSPTTVAVLRDNLAAHPRRGEPTAPLFPAMRLVAQKPTGRRATDENGKRIVPKAEDALAALTVDEAEARLTLDWVNPLLRDSVHHRSLPSGTDKSVCTPPVCRGGAAANKKSPGR